MAVLRVLIEDNQPVFRLGLSALLSSDYPDWDIRESDHSSAFRDSRETQFADLLIIRAELLGDGFACRHVTNSRTKIIGITEGSCAITTLGCTALGANATISRRMTSVAMLRTVGLLIFQDRQNDTDALRSAFAPSRLTPAIRGATSLSPRQMDVLRLLAKGKSNKAIARDLGLSLSTVKLHLSVLFRALGAHNRLEAAVLGRTSSEVLGASARQSSALSVNAA